MRLTTSSALIAALATATRRAPPLLCASGGGERFSDISLEALRAEQAEFVAERDWEQFHTPRSLALALVGEVGEVCELFQWRGDDGAAPGLPNWTAEEKTALADELSDVLSYVVRLSDVAGIDLPAAFLAKLEKNRGKYPSDKVRGSAAKYSSYAVGASPATGTEAQAEADGDDDDGERAWGTPQRVSDAYARAAARVAAARGESPPPSPAAEAAAAPPQIEVPRELPEFAVSDSFAASVQQRAAARAEAAFAAKQRAAQQQEKEDDAQEEEEQSVADGDAESKTDKKTAELVAFESIDDLYGFMEFGDGSANWS
jgi:dCTP diphosphatase